MNLSMVSWAVFVTALGALNLYGRFAAPRNAKRLEWREIEGGAALQAAAMPALYWFAMAWPLFAWWRGAALGDPAWLWAAGGGAAGYALAALLSALASMALQKAHASIVLQETWSWPDVKRADYLLGLAAMALTFAAYILAW